MTLRLLFMHGTELIVDLKVKVVLGYIPNYSNAKSLACDTANGHALEDMQLQSDSCPMEPMAIYMYSNGFIHVYV